MKALTIFTASLAVATLVVLLLPLPALLTQAIAFLLVGNTLLGVAFMGMAASMNAEV